jgi:nucleotide-binding universal stress UspA family protein
MIRSIAVNAGESAYADVAQKHAIEMASLFDARLRAVVVWEPEDVEELRQSGAAEDPDQVAQQEVGEFIQSAAQANLTAEARFRGEGVTEGLLAEARECDLLVIGMPTEGVAQGDPLAEALLHDELPLLRKAESSVLVVCSPPRTIHNVLVVYHGGTDGKAALRLAGVLGERAEARLHVLAVQRNLMEAEELTASAEQYLAAYDVGSVTTLERSGAPDSEGQVLEAADAVEADLIIVGDEPYGLLERFFGEATAERLALATHIPVLVAR